MCAEHFYSKITFFFLSCMYFNLEDVGEWSSWIYSEYPKQRRSKSRKNKRLGKSVCELDLIPEFTWHPQRQSINHPLPPSLQNTLLLISPLFSWGHRQRKYHISIKADLFKDKKLTWQQKRYLDCVSMKASTGSLESVGAAFSSSALLFSLIGEAVLLFQFSSVQSLSLVQLFVTQWTAACQASLSITNSWSLLKVMSMESMMSSNHLLLCCLLLLSSIFSNIRIFSN